jgi:hypothetical protein
MLRNDELIVGECSFLAQNASPVFARESLRLYASQQAETRYLPNANQDMSGSFVVQVRVLAAKLKPISIAMDYRDYSILH